MLKVMTLVGTRPELIKMRRVIAELDKQVNHVLVHSGQNYDYELNQVFFDDLEIRKPDHFLGAAGETAAQRNRRFRHRAQHRARAKHGIAEKPLHSRMADARRRRQGKGQGGLPRPQTRT